MSTEPGNRPDDVGDRGDLVGREGPPIHPPSELAPMEPDVTIADGGPDAGRRTDEPAADETYGGTLPAAGHPLASRPEQAQEREETQRMPDFTGRTREMQGHMQDTMRGVREGEPTEAMTGMFSFLETIPNSAYYFAMLGSIVTSLFMFLNGKRWESIFVGLWAPTIISSAMFYKLLHPSRESRWMGR